MALLGRTADWQSPSCLATSLRRSFSPTPRGSDRSAFSHTGREFRRLTTSSSRNPKIWNTGIFLLHEGETSSFRDESRRAGSGLFSAQVDFEGPTRASQLG